jgi:hypothetical protein
MFLKHDEQLALDSCLRWIISVLDMYRIPHRHNLGSLTEELKKYIMSARG